MKKTMLIVAVSSFLAMAAQAYQVTGPVLEVTDAKIVVQKGKEKWEINRDATTKASGNPDIKVGDKVTVEYTMTATKIETKEGKKEIMNFHSFTVKAADGSPVALEKYKGQLVLIVNVASKCGFTPQYKGLEELYEKYKGRGFTILGFPCNQFGSQEPGSNEEIQSFCQLNYGVTFPVFAKIDVNGEKTDPVYQWLKSESPGILGIEAIKWNFTKFLVSKDGKVIKRYAPQTEPKDLEKDIEANL